jgi:nucleotide-binding universal stress UspA family protein
VSEGKPTVKILIALDDSPHALRAAQEAARLFPDAEYLVINVSGRVVPWVMGDYGTVYPMHLADLPDDGLDDAEIESRVERAGLDDARVIATEGDPAPMICAAAEAHDVDVVVVGSRDKGLLRRLFEPSVAQAVVQGTYRPVLVVSGEPPSEDVDEQGDRHGA